MRSPRTSVERQIDSIAVETKSGMKRKMMKKMRFPSPQLVDSVKSTMNIVTAIIIAGKIPSKTAS
jgi:hypothetical protein